MRCFTAMDVLPGDDGEVPLFTQISDSFGLRCKDPSLAQQSEAEAADINTIVRRFGLTGQLPDNIRVPIAEDFVDIMDFHGAMNAVLESQASFNAMPADVRARFDNDPARFVEFCLARKDDGVLVNLEEMRKMGLAVPAVVETGKPASGPVPGADGA